MNYMFKEGFLGLKAPLFMDITTLIVALLPFLVYIGVIIAKKGYIKVHAILQIMLFIITIVILGWFEYGVRVGGGFKNFAQNSSLPHSFLVIFLIFHITVATGTIIYWGYTLFFVLKHYFENDLKGEILKKHIKEATITQIGIFFTSLTGVMVYIFLFLF